jgi:hypothetical protein
MSPGVASNAPRAAHARAKSGARTAALVNSWAAGRGRQRIGLPRRRASEAHRRAFKPSIYSPQIERLTSANSPAQAIDPLGRLAPIWLLAELELTTGRSRQQPNGLRRQRRAGRRRAGGLPGSRPPTQRQRQPRERRVELPGGSGLIAGSPTTGPDFVLDDAGER